MRETKTRAKPGGYLDAEALEIAIGCNKRLRQEMDTLLSNASAVKQTMIIARAALILNEQFEALRLMEKIRAKEEPAGTNGGQG